MIPGGSQGNVNRKFAYDQSDHRRKNQILHRQARPTIVLDCSNFSSVRPGELEKWLPLARCPVFPFIRRIQRLSGIETSVNGHSSTFGLSSQPGPAWQQAEASCNFLKPNVFTGPSLQF